MLITKKELTITGSRLQTNQFGKVVELINEKKLTHNGLVTHKFPLMKIKEAFEFIEQNPQLVRKADYRIRVNAVKEIKLESFQIRESIH